jgi:hypothetical protein
VSSPALDRASTRQGSIGGYTITDMDDFDVNNVAEWDEWPGDTIVVIPCSEAKTPYAAKVEHLYTGPLFQMALAAARALVPDEWIRVLSARHGLVPLDLMLDPYDTTWKSPEHVTDYQLVAQVRFLPEHSCVVSLLPQNYSKRLKQAFDYSTVDETIITPFYQARGVGDQRHVLSGTAKLVDDSEDHR